MSPARRWRIACSLSSKRHARGPLAEFARAYVRRAPAALAVEVEVADLAAQIAGAFEFMSSRSPGQLAVRVYRPDHERDGYGCPGSVVEVNVEDQPFLVDTVTAEMHAHGLGVRLVVHPVIGVERDSSGSVTAVTPARGAPHRESVMHFETDRALERGRGRAAGGRPAPGAGRAGAGRARLPAHGRPGGADDGGGRRRRRALLAGGDPGVGGIPAVADRRQLHLPRLPRVRDHSGAATTVCCGRSPIRAWASCPTRPGRASPRACGWPTCGPASGPGWRRAAGVDLQDQSRDHHPPPRQDGLHRGQAGGGRPGGR